MNKVIESISEDNMYLTDYQIFYSNAEEMNEIIKKLMELGFEVDNGKNLLKYRIDLTNYNNFVFINYGGFKGFFRTSMSHPNKIGINYDEFMNMVSVFSSPVKNRVRWYNHGKLEESMKLKSYNDFHNL